MHRTRLGIANELARDIAHLEFRSGNEFCTELLFQLQASREGKRLVDGEGGRLRAHAALASEFEAQRGILQPTCGKLARSGFADGETRSFELRMRAADAHRNIIERKGESRCLRRAGEHKYQFEFHEAKRV